MKNYFEFMKKGEAVKLFNYCKGFDEIENVEYWEHKKAVVIIGACPEHVFSFVDNNLLRWFVAYFNFNF